ncbi:MAG: hypothetical protein WC496_07285 [Phycisphaerae bacterium]|jgi:flagellar biosynthesis chaperone FliJ
MIPANKKSSVSIIPAFIVLNLILILPTHIFAQTDTNLSSVRRKPIEKVQLVSFNLTDGRRVSGEIVNEDPFNIEISEIKGSKILLSTYSKNDIDKKSIINKTVSELDYWRDTGKYFEQKVWDFQDDPDEFIQAIRCFENARAVAEGALGPEHKLVMELDEKISLIKTDMEKWAQQAKARSEMRNMELLSTLDARLQQMQEQITESSNNIEAIRRELANNTVAIGGYKALNKKMNSIEVAAKLLEQRLLRVEDDMTNLWRGNRYRPRYYVLPKDPNH